MTALSYRHLGQGGPVANVVVAAAVAVLVAGVMTVAGDRSTGELVVGLVLAALAAALFATPRLEIGLLIIALYLGLVDGPLKLSTTNPVAPLLRDVVIYAVVAGGLVRWYAARKPLKLPPLSPWVLACCAVVVVQALNPATTSAVAAGAGIRQLLEFVPLFFVAFAVVNSEQRLRAMLLVLLIVGAANGIVSAIQFPMSPDQLASWGPGYADIIKGTGEFRDAARVFGDAQVRPLGLGGDAGAPGMFGFIALPAALALFAVARTNAHRVGIAVLAMACLLGVITSQARAGLLAGLVTVVAFIVLAVASRRVAGVALGVLVGIVAAYGMLTALTGGSEQAGVYFRYGSLNPSEFLAEGFDDHGHALPALAGYFSEIPFGAGLASSGPARQVQAATHPEYNAEGAANFLVIEAGIVGLLVFLAFFVRLAIGAVLRVRRIAGGDERLMLSAVVAPLFGIGVVGTFATILATAPTAPYLWASAGVISSMLFARARSRAL